MLLTWATKTLHTRGLSRGGKISRVLQMMSHGCYGVNNSLNDVMFHVADVRVCDDITESRDVKMAFQLNHSSENSIVLEQPKLQKQ